MQKTAFWFVRDNALFAYKSCFIAYFAIKHVSIPYPFYYGFHASAVQKA